MFFSSDDRIVDGNLPVLEALEERLMLTTMVGGQTGEFWAPLTDDPYNPFNGHNIRVILEGDIIAEFLGVGLAMGNTVTVGDLPIKVTGGGSVSIAGGLGAFDGVTLIGPTPITDTTGPTTDYAVPDDDLNIQAIASQDYLTGGKTYGFNVYVDTTGSFRTTEVQLLEINNATGDATVVADLSGILPFTIEQDDQGNDVEVPDVVGVTGADFRPLDGSNEEGWLYFVCASEPTDDDEDPSYQLFALDVNQDPDPAANRAAIEGGPDLAPLGTLTDSDEQVVPSIAWESSDQGSTLFMMLVEDEEVADVYTVIPPASSVVNLTQVCTVTLILPDGEVADDWEIGGIEFVNDDPEGDRERYLYATYVDGADSLLLRIDLTGDDQATPPEAPGTAEILEYLHGWNPQDPTDTRYPPGYTGDVRGDNIQGVAWNPVLVNPFTSGYGVLIGTDVTTDELVYIRTGSNEDLPSKPMLWGWTYGFAVYVSYAGEGSSISFAPVDDAAPGRPVIPFTGSIWDVYINDAQTGDLIYISAPDATGNSVLGAQTMNYYDTPDLPDQGALIIRTNVNAEMGVRPEHYDDWPGVVPVDTVNYDLSAGLVVAENLLEFLSNASDFDGRMLGMNLDDIREMAVSRGGEIVVVDYDGKDALGQSYYDVDGDGMWDPDEDIIIGAQISLVDPDTGYAIDDDTTDGEEYDPLSILDSVDGTPVTGVWGLDFGDIGMDGHEELYAICTVGRTYSMWLGTITLDYPGDQAIFTGIVELEDQNGAPMQQVKAMAFSPGQGSIDGQQGLYVMDRGNRLYEVNPVTGETISGGHQIWGDLAYPDGSPVLDENGATIMEIITVESMDFDDDGNLYAHDRRSGRLVDISMSGFGGVPAPQLLAGTRTATSVGSMPPSIGAMSYDFAEDRFLAVDNVYGCFFRGDEASWDDQNLVDNRANDSSIMMVLRGTDSDSAEGQNLDTFMYGGTVTGKIDTSGSIDTFYAGWLITGRPGPTPPDSGWNGTNAVADGLLEGDLADNAQYITDNFNVRGDLRNLISKGSIGTDVIAAGGTVGSGPTRSIDDPTYLTGFDLQVGGKLGQLWSLDSMAGRATVENQPDVVHFDAGDFYQEIEYIASGGSVQSPQTNAISTAWHSFRLLGPAGEFLNDDMATAQYLGATFGGELGDPDVVRVSGELGSGDNVDYYAVGLMAGQTITVQMIGAWDVGVFDPDGRLIATDRSDVADLVTHGGPFQVTTERAGMHFFAVGAAPFDGTTNVSDEYDLYIDFVDDLDDLALGAVRVGGTILNYQDDGAMSATDPRVWVIRGDLGAVVIGGSYISEVNGNGWDILLEAGNLRAVSSIASGWYRGAGTGVDAAYEDGLYVAVYGGSVGLLRATDAGSALLFSDITVQGDVQTIESAGQFGCFLSAWGGIGNLRVGDWSLRGAVSEIRVNSDEYGRDGIIDLIDVAGDLGTTENGGPYIYTGEGGNVRFMRVGGSVYQNVEWASSEPVDTDVPPGEPIHLWDDSGTRISLYPTPDTVNSASGTVPIDPLTGLPDIDPATGAPFVLPSLNVLYYGINDSGGVVIIDVVASDGLKVVADSNTNGDPAEIGRITVNGAGRAVQVDPIDGSLTLAPHPYAGFTTDLTVLVESRQDDDEDLGDSPVDVFEVVGGNFTSIRNLTGGDIVNVNATSIGLLESLGSLGTTPTHHGAEIDATTELSDALPFSQQTIGIVSGDIITAQAGKAAANFIVTGDIGSLTANFDGQVDHTDGEYRGITGPIYATGDIGDVQIGEGVARTGTGAFAHAGLYADGVIHRVTNQGIGSDIRGDIIGTLGVDLIHLVDGAIIDADIFAGGFNNTLEWAFETMFGDIGEIRIVGDGGIIGAFIRASSIGRIHVDGGFGIFTSCIASTGGNGRIGDVTVDGFGLYGIWFSGGAFIEDVLATGRGDLGNAMDYTPTVRQSEDYLYEPLFGSRMSILNDIHAVLGTSATFPLLPKGIWNGVDASSQLNLKSAKGYQFYDVQLTFANSIGTIETLDLINGLRIVTGHVNQFKPGSDVYGLDMNVAGLINKIIVKGDLAADSSIQAYGSNGNIKSLTVYGDFDGELITDGTVGAVTIRGDLSGQFDIDDTNNKRYALGKLTLGGSLRNGALDIDGNVGSIRIAQDLGLAGDSLYINGNLGSVYVGMNKTIHGSTMLLDLNVVGNLGTLDVTGRLDGEVYVGGNLKKMVVRADAETADDGDLVTEQVLIRGNLGSALIQGGSLDADVTAGNNIGTFTIAGGDLAEGAVLTSSFGDIGKVQIRTGDLLGEIHADRGSIGTIQVGGSDLGGASVITAQALANLNVDGAATGEARVDIVNELGTVRIGGDVEADAVIRAGSSKSVTVAGSLRGLVDLGPAPKGTTVKVGTDLIGELSIDGNATVTVSGDLADTSRLAVGGDLKGLTVAALLAGDVFVDGYGGRIQAGCTDGAVLTTGFDLASLTVKGTMTHTLVQVGISRGLDGAFADGVDVTVDLGETGRMARLGAATITGLMSGSILAAGGDVGKVAVKGGMNSSSISSGLNLGSNAIADVIDDASPLANENEQNAARDGDGRQLLRGDIGSAVINGAGMVASDLTAGVDPGTDGDFMTDIGVRPATAIRRSWPTPGSAPRGEARPPRRARSTTT